MIQTSEIWSTSASGILVHTGTVSDASTQQSTNFLSLKDKAQTIQHLYASAGLSIPESCDLARLIENAKLLSDRWLTNQIAEATMLDVFQALHLDRVADAILPLKDVSGKEKYLRDLCFGDLDFFKHEKSHTKNVFWELELWSSLCRRCSSVRLLDPPDIVIDIDDSVVGIACKKIYSEKNVEKVLSEAVSQVEDHFDVGIVAINLDDLTPPDTVLRARDEAEMYHMLNEHNDAFITRHERHFRKYLSTGRLVSALVSVNMVAEILDWRVPSNNVRQSTIWTIPGLPPEKEALMRQFREIVLAYPFGGK